MQEAIEREGKYRRIQGSNVDITKQAIGCGFVKMGGPISGTIPADKKIVYLLNWIHDEIVSEAPEQNIVDAGAMVAGARRTSRWAIGEEHRDDNGRTHQTTLAQIGDEIETLLEEIKTRGEGADGGSSWDRSGIRCLRG